MVSTEDFDPSQKFFYTISDVQAKKISSLNTDDEIKDLISQLFLRTTTKILSSIINSGNIDHMFPKDSFMGININRLPTSTYVSLMCVAISEERTDLVRFLFQKGSKIINPCISPWKNYVTPIEYAAQFDNVSIFDIVLDATIKSQWFRPKTLTPALNVAIAKGNINYVEKFLAVGADLKHPSTFKVINSLSYINNYIDWGLPVENF